MLSRSKRTKLRNRIWPYVVLRREFWNVPRAIRGCRKISESDRGCLHVLICDHIGDFVYTMGYMDALRKNTGYERISIYMTKKFAELAERLYPSKVDKIIVLDNRKLHSLLLIDSTWNGENKYKKLENLMVVNPTNAFTAESYEYIEKYPGMCFSDCIKYGCLNLTEDASFEPPDLRKLKESVDNKADIEKNFEKSVIFAPHARYLAETDTDIWHKTVAELNNLGYKTYTAVEDICEAPIKGSEPLVCSLFELLIFAEKAKAVIGTRSGVFDLLAYTGSMLIAVYPDDCNNRSFHSMGQLPDIKAGYRELTETDFKKGIISALIDRKI